MDDPTKLDLSFGTKRGRYTIRVFVLTFLAYMSFHLSRKPASIVKSTLHPSSPNGYSKFNPVTDPGYSPFNRDLDYREVAKVGYHIWDTTDEVTGDYACQAFGTGDLSDVCVSYIRSPAAYLNYTGYGTTSEHCWEILTGKEVPLFVQNRADAPKKLCQPLPASTTETSTQWHATANTDAETPQMAPKVTNGKILLGGLDTIFLAFYAIGMFCSGYIGDRVNLRIFLWIGMWGSAVFVAMIGLGFYFHTHSFWYYGGMYMIQGLFQSIGWPSVVAVMGNWVPHGTRGLPLGIWNAHTSVGNILGSLIGVAGLTLGMHNEDWPAAFFLCAACIFFTGALSALFLKPHPNEVGLTSPNDVGEGKTEDLTFRPQMSPMAVGGGGEEPYAVALEDPLLEQMAPKKEAGGICRALMIPGVIPFALSLAFCKLIAYTFIYWLPLYLTHLNYSSAEAGQLSTFFDLGGIIGGIIAGFLSDKLKMPGTVATGFLIVSIPTLYMYRAVTHHIKDSSMSQNIALMLFAGAVVNGPYALITTAISADLGSHKSLKGEPTLMATVTSIIDGTGSVGAAVQGILIGWLASRYSWNGVFYVLNICNILSALCLSYVVLKECRRKCGRQKLTAVDEDY